MYMYIDLMLTFLYKESEAMIRIEGKNEARSCLPHKSEMMCTLAVSTLEDVCQNVCTGHIVVKDMEMILHRKDHMERLCSALKLGSLDRQGGEYDLIKAELEKRENELRAFKNHRSLLGHLCQGVTVKVSGRLK